MKRRDFIQALGLTTLAIPLIGTIKLSEPVKDVLSGPIDNVIKIYGEGKWRIFDANTEEVLDEGKFNDALGQFDLDVSKYKGREIIITAISTGIHYVKVGPIIPDNPIIFIPLFQEQIYT